MYVAACTTRAARGSGSHAIPSAVLTAGTSARTGEPSPVMLSACRIPGRRTGNRIALAAMNATAPPAGDLYLVVGYDGSPPATRALDAAIRLLQGRAGSIEVVYVAHLSSIDSLSPGAVVEMEATFDDIARELHTAASEQLRDREERWRFERREGLITDELIAAATDIRNAHPGDSVVIAVGSSSHAMHRVVGSVAVGLARRSAVPLVVVP
jgi:nucleotide-binding universal stress UspA family protein